MTLVLLFLVAAFVALSVATVVFVHRRTHRNVVIDLRLEGHVPDPERVKK